MAEAYYEENLRPKGFVPRLLEGERKASIGRFYPPSTAQLEYEGPRGPQFVLTAWFTPIDETRSRVHALMATPKGWVPAWTKELLLRVIFHRVLEQDRKALLDQQANISRFGGPRFTSTSLDVMRGHILYFLRRTADSPPAEFETTLTMEL